ncbi:MAG: ABC transporter ATP-binding protein [Erysipelotrichaceae bacterium]|nr:ABC transporter ATP-binding protein [Erysipelotrichaceae bacterium]MBQ1534706.1 ABC transporter ATP-binding protein [Erysipelotrichaceae bacterium]
MMSAVIEFKDFSFRYKTQNEFTLHDINLTINKGEKVLILGPSGSGKTTLGSCINGLIPFSFDGEIKGSCKVCGLETKEASIFRISEHVGTVQQDTDAQFVGLSVGEDIAFSLENDMVPRPEMLERVDASAKIVGMEKFLKSVPYNISGGQKQKTALAGILHNDVEILLFDEPLASLDPAMGMNAVDLIDRIYRDHHKTILIIEHRLEDVLYRHVDRIILMNEGRILLDTTPDRLLSSNLLKENGIREPLYISALKNAGVVFTEDDRLASIEDLDIGKYKDKILKHFHAVKTGEAKEKKKKLIEVKNVTYCYGDYAALKDISFDLYEGERIAVVGKNGAGKSTLAKLLCGIIRPSRGQILIEGEDYLKYSIKELGEIVGYVMQNPNQMLVKDIIREEIELALKLNGFPEEVISQRVEDTLRMAGLYPMRNWPVSVLSYGQKKRVTIASILALQPKVIILDEPTAGQDYFHYTEIMNFICELNEKHNITILFVTHDMHLAIEYTDRAIVFTDGEMIGDDVVYRILSDDGIIERASLKKTSLVTIAQKAGIDPEEYIHYFIECEKKERENG